MEKKKLIKKIIPVAVVLIVIAIIMIIVMPNLIVYSVVSGYAKALENKDVIKMLDYIDSRGAFVWKNGDFDSDDFSKSDYDYFTKEYDDVRSTDFHNARDVIKEYYDDFFNGGDSESIYISGKIEKLGKSLYLIRVERSVGGPGWGRSWT